MCSRWCGVVSGQVVRTGFATTKGSLIISILFPRPSSFKFVRQSYFFIAFLFGIAMIGFVIRYRDYMHHVCVCVCVCACVCFKSHARTRAQSIYALSFVCVVTASGGWIRLEQTVRPWSSEHWT